MRLVFVKLALIAPLLLIGACHQQADTSGVTNSVIDNTVGTASDAMTNVDATIGSAANMAADVPAAGGDDGADNTPAGGDAGSGENEKPAAAPKPKPVHHTKPAVAKPAAPKLDSDPGN